MEGAHSAPWAAAASAGYAATTAKKSASATGANAASTSTSGPGLGASEAAAAPGRVPGASDQAVVGAPAQEALHAPISSRTYFILPASPPSSSDSTILRRMLRTRAESPAYSAESVSISRANE